MIDVIKKTLLAGIGAAVITKDKVESALNEFVQQGKVSSTEARAMAEKIADQGRREFDTMSHELSEKLRERFSGYDRTAQQRIDFLEARIAVLEKAAGVVSEAGTTATMTPPPPASPPLPSPGA
jgi:polyhydroxyalkanoate synthesis regulator phasin